MNQLQTNTLTFFTANSVIRHSTAFFAQSLVDIAKQYHLEKGARMPPNVQPPEDVITRGLLDSPVVAGNRKYYE